MHIEVAGEADDGHEALRLTRELAPDVVLMDIRMPNLDGLQATRRLLAEPDAPRVLVLTTFDADEYVYKAMQAGASGFLLKTASPEQLAGAIRAVAAGDTLLALPSRAGWLSASYGALRPERSGHASSTR